MNSEIITDMKKPYYNPFAEIVSVSIEHQICSASKPLHVNGTVVTGGTSGSTPGGGL